MSDQKEDAATVTDTAQATAEGEAPFTNGTLPVSNVRKAIRAVKRHPLGAIALVGAAISLIEVELAIGILAGIGATALLTSTNGPAMRQEVVAKSKWALERARAVTSRVKSPTAEAAPTAVAEVPTAAA